MANMPTQASCPVMEVDSDGGGVMSGCGDPFWETVEQGGLQNLQLLVGWVELQSSYPQQKAGRYTRMHGNAVAHVQFTPLTVESWEKDAPAHWYCAALCDVIEVSGVLRGRLQRWRGHYWTRQQATTAGGCTSVGRAASRRQAREL